MNADRQAPVIDALGHAPTAAQRPRFPLPQTSMLLLVGVGLGPAGIAVLTPPVLALVDPALPVALTALGVLIASRLGSRELALPRLLAAAGLESVLTGVIVALGTLLMAPLILPGGGNPLVVACVAGICAATSSAIPVSSNTEHGWMSRLRDLDVLFPMTVAAVLAALVREPATGAALWLVAQTCGATVIIAGAGWLLLSASASDTEQRVIMVAVLLLLGGLADYLSMPALLGGVVAGFVWRRTDARVAELVDREIAHVRRPLVALVLIVAGARMAPTVTLLLLSVGYVVLRGGGKLLGAAAAVRLASLPVSGPVFSALIHPGALGVAFAVDALLIVGQGVAPILTIVILGTIWTELLALLRPEARAE